MSAAQVAVSELEERVLSAALYLHLESGETPDPERWRAFRRAVEALWKGDPKRQEDKR